ncbi:MAG TPA: alkaline phosphatase PhoX, partial [Burkholderiaceae bacterium]|nr:alkaline phosphatase PhoX [Burkholderiaceae bacterium]
MAKDFSAMENSNSSANRSIHEVSDPARRIVLRGGLSGVTTALLAPLAATSGALTLGACAAGGGKSAAAARIGFKSIPASTADTVVVPEGYTAEVIAPWGEPVGLAASMPAFKEDAGNSAEEQEAQLGMHHD